MIGRTQQPVLRHFSTTGDLVLELRLPLSTRPISDSDRAGILEELFGITEGLLMEMETAPDVGSHYPLTTALYSVNDTTFAMYHSARIRAREDTPLPEGRTVWRLFTVSGRYAGTLWFPEDFGLPIWVGGGHLVGVARNALGVATTMEVLSDDGRILSGAPSVPCLGIGTGRAQLSGFSKPMYVL